MLHTVIHWIIQQLAMTWQQITVDVTIPHIITGIILYWIVHTASKRGSKKALIIEKSLKTHTELFIEKHVWKRHKGSPFKCDEPDCKDSIALITEQRTGLDKLA